MVVSVVRDRRASLADNLGLARPPVRDGDVAALDGAGNQHLAGRPASPFSRLWCTEIGFVGIVRIIAKRRHWTRKSRNYPALSSRHLVRAAARFSLKFLRLIEMIVYG